ncbi:MAG: hypothetical protein NTW80_13805 [Deltaproteobacteria bacterium]|nr:hypothetical protein [Deltaproteobacteria bacterium]
MFNQARKVILNLCLKLFNKITIIRVRTDPKPDQNFPLHKAKRPPAQADADRINGLDFMNLFEVQDRLPGFFFPHPEDFSGIALNGKR